MRKYCNPPSPAFALCSLAAAALALALFSPAPVLLADDPPAPAAAPKLILPDQPAYDPVNRRLSLGGTAEVPDGMILAVQVFFGDAPGPRNQARVAGRKFKFEFPPVEKDRHFLPGKYRFIVDCIAADQPPAIRDALAGQPPLTTEVEVVVGDPDEGERIKAEVRTSYVKLADELRKLYQTMESEASYTVGRIIGARTKAGGHVPEAEAKRIASTWEDFCKRHVDERLRLHRLDFQELRAGCYIAPLPEVEREVDSLLLLIEKWYAACYVEIAKYLELEAPKAATTLGSVGKRELLPQILEAAERIAKGLGVQAEEWGQVNPFRPEEGLVDGRAYLSKSSKFRIEAAEGWDFNTEVVHTTVRIRLLHKDPEKAKVCVVAVELMDFPECEAPKDLDTAVELATTERWPGFKKIKGGPIKAKDSKMPDGLRPGYAMQALAIDPTGQRFIVYEHALYCRWYKRTYTVVTICQEESWESVKDDVEKINHSFQVLDRAE